MRKNLATFALAVGIGVGGVAVLGPTLAQAQQDPTPTPSQQAPSEQAPSQQAPSQQAPSEQDRERTAADALAERADRIERALAGLVSDGTITQEQADKVARTLAERLPGRGPGGHRSGPHAGRLFPDAVASALGITTDELRTALRSGKTLAQIAEDEDIARDELVDKLVAAAEAQIAAAVEAGRLTQAQADQLSENLHARINERVDRSGPPFGRWHGHGPRGHGRGSADRSGADSGDTAES